MLNKKRFGIAVVILSVAISSSAFTTVSGNKMEIDCSLENFIRMEREIKRLNKESVIMLRLWRLTGQEKWHDIAEDIWGARSKIESRKRLCERDIVDGLIKENNERYIRGHRYSLETEAVFDKFKVDRARVPDPDTIDSLHADCERRNGD